MSVLKIGPKMLMKGSNMVWIMAKSTDLLNRVNKLFVLPDGAKELDHLTLSESCKFPLFLKVENSEFPFLVKKGCLSKGQIILKGLFGVLEFSQKIRSFVFW
jgi:hypothetical protein